MRNLFAKSSLAANLQTNLQSVADLARQSMTKREAPGDLSSLQQVPEGTPHEARLLRGQVTVLKSKNTLLQQQVLNEENHATEAVQLKAEVEDLKVKLVFALKRSGAEAIVPKVLEELQRQKNSLAEDLAAAEADARALRVENLDLRFKIEEVEAARLGGQALDLSPAPAGSSVHAGELQRLNETMSQLRDQLHVQAQVAELAAQEHAKTVARLKAKLAEVEAEALQTSHQASQIQAAPAPPLPVDGWDVDADQDGWGLDDELLEPLDISAPSQSNGFSPESQAAPSMSAWAEEKASLVERILELEGVLQAADVTAAQAGAGPATWDQERSALGERIQELEAGLSAAEVAAAQAGAGSAAWDQERRTLDAKIKELDATLASGGQAQKRGSGSGRASDLEAQISDLRSEGKATLEAKIEELSALKTAWAEEKSVLETKLQVLEDDKTALLAAGSAAWAEERGVLEGKASALEQQVKVETAKVSDLVEQLKSSEGVIHECDLCPSLRTELEELSKQQISGSETIRLLEAEVYEKASLCASLERDVQSLGLERAQLAEKNAEDLADLESLTGSNAGLEKLLDAAEVHNEDLRKEVAELEKELHRAQTAPSKAAAQKQGPSPGHEALVEDLRREVAGLEKELHKAQTAAADAIVDGVAHQGGATVIQSQTQTQVLTAGDVGAESLDGVDSAEMNKLKASNTQLREYNKSLREEMSAKQENVSALETQVEELSASLAKLGSNYARQFERHEADHSTELDALRKKHAVELAKLDQDLATARSNLEKDRKEAEKKFCTLKKGPTKAEKEAQEKAEFLQQELKEKAQEIEDLYSHATLSSKRVAAAETATAKAVRKLEQAQTKCSGLETASAELAIAKKRVEVAEGKASSLEAAVAATSVKMGDLQAKIVELESCCKVLEEETMHLKTLVEQREEFENQVQRMTLELADMGMLQHRLESAESARDRHQADATRTGMMLSNLEQRLLQVEEDNEKLSSSLDEERRRGAASVRSWAADLDGLAAVSRNRWPAPVLRLVEEVESRAANENREMGSAAVQEARAAVADELDELRGQVQSLEQSLEGSKAIVLRLEARVAHATEASVAAAEQYNAELASQVEELRAQHYAALEAVELESSASRKEAGQWKERAEKVVEELTILRNKTRELMEEKETEVESLRSTLRKAGIVSSAVAAAAVSNAVASVLDSSGMSDGGAAPPGIVSANSLSSRPSSAVADGEDTHEYWQAMSNRYKQAYDDSEHTHTLRNQTEAALKDEVAKLHALTQLVDGDVSYMRSVIISGFVSGELPKVGSIFPVLSRLLRFTPQETEKIMSSKSTHQAATSVVISPASALSYFLGTGTK
eukprot:gene2346-8648_t